MRCSHCRGKHHVLVCFSAPSAQQGQSTAVQDTSKNVPAPPSAEVALSSYVCSADVKLQTLKVQLRSAVGTRIVRVLIDSGSQRSYVDAETVRDLGCSELGQEEIVHSLFGGAQTDRQRHCRYRISVGSLQGDFWCNFEVLDHPRICAPLPEVQFGPWVNELNHKGIFLSDTEAVNPECRKPSDLKIHILIGADVAGKLWTGRTCSLVCGLVAMETRLGWALMGKTNCPVSDPPAALHVVTMLTREACISDLWRLDSLGITEPTQTQKAQELHEAAAQHFRDTVRRDEEGRYEVSLPWLDGHPTLPTNFSMAEKRLRTTVSRLQREGLLTSYQDVFQNWLSQGIIERVPSAALKDVGHYLPHRAVVKENSETTKIRPVFDASAHTFGQASLNHCLEKGPNLIESLSAVLTRFRLGAFAAVADIKQAFLQISVSETDRDYLRFLWWEEGNPENLQVYRHRRVVFGLSASPFLLGATLAYHLDRTEQDRLKGTVTTLQNSLYVDNCLVSVDNIETLGQFVQESRELLASAKFDLRGWRFNSVPPGCAKLVPVSPAHEEKTLTAILGLQWNFHKDTLQCDCTGQVTARDTPITKRGLLSAAHKLFDPIGVVCPVSLVPKLLLQKCWTLGCTWDQELPDIISSPFLKWQNQLPELASLEIPRWLIGIKGSGTLRKFSLHVFCDASQKAFATCVYLRTEHSSGISCQLVQAKARVAPVKDITIPRLELLACVIGTRLAATIKKDIQIKDLPTIYWTDSTNALFWIGKEEQWATFVGNRVREIRTCSEPGDWRHVPGSANPADLPSRGCTPRQLLASKWWEGPEWLRSPPSEWPSTEPVPDLELVYQEKRKTVVSVPSLETEIRWYCGRICSYPRLIRMFAWIQRFVGNSRRSSADRDRGDLSSEEVQRGEYLLLTVVQREEFLGTEDPSLRALRRAGSDGLLRIRTRLVMRADTEDFRRPILLPANNPVVDSLILWRHRHLCHAGVQILMTDLRERYWIIRARRTIRRVLSRCVICQRFRAISIQTEPAPLPECRIRDAVVFEIIGIDLAGPLFLRKHQKVWIVLYTCAIFRAIHLELVSSLSTDSFLLSFRRFVARRGTPSVVYSDNGTNFVGAARSWRKIDWEHVQATAGIQRIKWHLIPPTGAWWGGWWERLVRMVKELLRRVLGRALLSYEELLTILCDTEAVLNSRPLTYVSEDSNDLLTPLTPSLFLHEAPTVGPTCLEELDKAGLQRRLLYRKKLRDDLQSRFRSEYLGQLRQPPPPSRRTSAIEVGQVVLVEALNRKRQEWSLGRIVQTYPGRDGIVRVARTCTGKGTYVRPVQRLYPLEVGEQAAAQLRERTREASDTDGTQESQCKTDDVPYITRSGRTVRVPEPYRSGTTV